MRRGGAGGRWMSQRLVMNALWACAVWGLASAAVAQRAAPARVAAVAAPRYLTDSQWREDLRYLAGQIRKVHPHPFHHVPEAQFDAAVAALDSEIPTLSDHEIEVRLAQLVALLGEGHSRVSLPGLADPMSDVPQVTPSKDPRLAFHRLPVQLSAFTDGLFVVGATDEYRSLIGSQVVQIGDRPAQAALEAVQPVINRDNDMGVRLIGPGLVATPEVLKARRVTGEEARTPVTFRARDGAVTRIDLSPLPAGGAERWVHAPDARHAPGSLYARHSSENLWAEYEPGSGTLLVGVNVIKDAPGRSVASIAAGLEALAKAHPPKRFVLDLRDCHGGDNSKFRGLLLAILRNEALNRPGQSFVLINRATFSAAVNSASDMERLANTIFVGEPTAGSPSSWGDPHRVTLPNSGLVARISSIYWRDWTADESRPWIAPDLPAAISSSDYFGGKDPAMAAVLRFAPPADFAGLLAGLVRGGASSDAVLRLYYQHKTDPVWAAATTEPAMQRAGEAFLARKSYDDAFLMFAVNSRDYPGSRLRAAGAVESAMKGDPANGDLQRLTKKVEGLKPPS
jgi:hypothetical protein